MAFNTQEISGLYQKNLGRAPSDEETQGWTSGAYGPDPYSQIPQSGEAQTYRNRQTPPTSNAGSPASPQPGPIGGDQIKQWYEQYLGRDPENQDVVNQWLTQGAGAQGGIQGSAEAQSYAAQSTPASNTPPPTSGNPYDPNTVVAGWMSGNNPQGHQDASYWTRRIAETGGLNAGNIDYWKGRFLEAPGTHVEGPTGIPGGGTGGWGGSIGSSTWNLPAALPPDPRGAALYDQLMRRANQSLNVDPNDPIIRSQTDAFNAQQTRANRGYLSGLAEKAGPNTNLTAETRAASEHAGQAGGAFQAQLMQNELGARRQEIQQALSEGGQLLSFQDQLALQQELGRIDASLRGQQMGMQNQQFYAGLGSQNDQFAATFGANATQQANYWDWLRSTGHAPS